MSQPNSAPFGRAPTRSNFSDIALFAWAPFLSHLISFSHKAVELVFLAPLNPWEKEKDREKELL